MEPSATMVGRHAVAVGEAVAGAGAPLLWLPSLILSTLLLSTVGRTVGQLALPGAQVLGFGPARTYAAKSHMWRAPYV